MRHIDIFLSQKRHYEKGKVCFELRRGRSTNIHKDFKKIAKLSIII